MNKEVKYENPSVEIIEVEVEKGFAISDGGGEGTLPGEDPIA